MEEKGRGEASVTADFWPELLDTYSCHLLRWGRLWERSRFVGGVAVRFIRSMV